MSVSIPNFIEPKITSTSIELKWVALDLKDVYTANGDALEAKDVKIVIYRKETARNATPPTLEEVFASTDTHEVSGTEVSLKIEGLTAFNDYYFAIKTINTTGAKVEKISDTLLKYTTKSQATEVDIPAFTTPAITGTSITLKWNALDMTNAKKGEGTSLANTEVHIYIYYVERARDAAAPDMDTVYAGTEIGPLQGDTLQYLIDNLTKERDYYFALKTVNSTDTSKTMKALTPTKYQTLKGATTVAIPTFAEAITTTSITFTWDKDTQLLNGDNSGTNALNENGKDIAASDVTFIAYYYVNPPRAGVPTDATVIAANNTISVTADTGTLAITGLKSGYPYYVLIRSSNNTNTTKIVDKPAAFYRASFTYTPADLEELSAAVILSRFVNGVLINDPDLNGIDVSGVSDFSGIFSLKLGEQWSVGEVNFNPNMDYWDVSNATNMARMFYGVTAFDNASVTYWDVSNVTDISEMFFGATSFNQDISDWDLSAVTNVANMFDGASAFNQNLDDWNDHISNLRTSVTNDASKINKIFDSSGIANNTNYPCWYDSTKKTLKTCP